MIATYTGLMIAFVAASATTEPTAMPVPAGVVMGPPAGGPPGDPKQEFPKFEEVTKDMKTREGFFTLYHDEKKDKLLARVPKTMLNKNFLLATSIFSGRGFAGWQWADGPVYWDRLDKKLILMAAEPRYVSGKGSTVEDVIGRTYTDWILRALPIVTEVEGDPVVDLAELVKSDTFYFGEVYGGRVDRGLTRYGNIKNFEKNSEVSVNLAVMPRPQPGQPNVSIGGEVVGVHYSFSFLPENDYKPREADPRVGYFLTVLKDWTADHSEKTTFRRYINRWQVRKAEPDKDVSDVRPEDQIIFYVEKTVPVKYRQYVRDGILEWNKAFEAAGLRNAIAVRQQTDNNEYKDLDPEDIRYNFFRWMVTGEGYAMGPSRANPFTGQILDADIVWDDSMIRYLVEDFNVQGPRGGAAYSDGPVDEYLALNEVPSNQMGQVWDCFKSGETPLSRWTRFAQSPGHTHESPLHFHADSTCEMGIGATRQLAFASMVSAQAGQRNLPEEFIGQVVKEIVMHEVGHTLGLRHNFKASSWLKLSDIKCCQPNQGKATVASVMDYTAFNYAPTAAEQGLFDTATIGPYDYWAIEYGYRPYTPGKDDKPAADTAAPQPDTGATNGAEPKKDAPQPAEAPKAAAEAPAVKGPKPGLPGKVSGGPAKADSGEAKMLKAIASQCNEPGHAYATDEDTSLFAPDPLVNRWDSGDDPIAFSKDNIALANRLWKDGLDWAVKDGESWTRARRVMNYVVGAYGYTVPMVARMVGGQYVNRNHKGDPNGKPPLEAVPAEKQREALKYVAETALSDEAFQFSAALLNQLAPGRWGHWDTDEFDREVTYNLHGRVLSAQTWNLFQLINPFTLNRVYDSQALVPEGSDVFTVPELLSTISLVVWSELDSAASGNRAFTDRQPMVSSFRRSLQRHHVQSLIDAVLAKPGARLYADVHSVVRLSLKDLNSRIEKTLADRGNRFDDFTRAHLVDSSTRIKKALEADFVANPKPAASGGIVVRIGQDIAP